MRQVHPLLPAVVLGHDLDARGDQPDLGRRAELPLQPAPLVLPEHGRRRVGVRLVRPFAPGHGGLLLERAAPEVAGVEHDDLEPPPLGAEHPRVVDAGPPAARRVLGVAEEVEEDLLRLDLLGVVAAAVVDAEVVVVPGGEDRHRRAEGLEAGHGGEPGVLGAHHVHVLGVGVDVIAKGDESLRLHLDDRVPDRLRFVLLGTGAEGDPRQRRFVRHALSREGRA